MLPIVLNDHQVHLFNFYMGEKIRQGMRHKDGLYGLAQDFSAQMRLEAYRYASELAASGLPVVMTASAHGYRVWVSLQVEHQTYWHTAASIALSTA